MFDALSPFQSGLAFLIVAVAYVVRGISGFGSGLVAIPLLAMLFPLTTVVPCIGLLDYIASVHHGTRDRRSVQWREILPLLPFTLTGVLTALYLFHTVDGALLRRVLGGFVVLYAFYTLLSRRPPRRHTRRWAAVAGSLGGLVGTLFGTGGPFYVIYLTIRGLDKTAFRATIATIFMIDGGLRQSGYLLSGLYTRQTVALVAVGLPVMLLGLFVGGRIHTNLTQRHFQVAVATLLLCSGGVLLFR